MESKSESFSDLGVPHEIANGLKDAGLTEPSPIQAKAIPLGRQGKDIMAQVTPGSGKTCVFTVIALETVQMENRFPQVLILSPTRDLAKLTCFFINKIGKYVPAIISQCFITGSPLAEDILHLVDCQIVTGTPDRVKQLVEERHLNTTAIKLFVLNEADHLIKKGFFEQINWIASVLPPQKQTLVFSGKFTEDIQIKLSGLIKSPHTIIPAYHALKLYYLQVPPETHKGVFEWEYKKMIQILNSIPTWSWCIVYTQCDKASNSLLSSKFLEANWRSMIVQEGIAESPEKKKMLWQTVLKEGIRVLIVTDGQPVQFDGVNLIFSFGVPPDNISFTRQVGGSSNCIAITLGTETEVQQIIKVCHQLDVEPEILPSVLPSEFYSKPKMEAESAGISIPMIEMMLYQEMAKKAKNIRYLMETESWSHPRHQDVSRKIHRWRQELATAKKPEDYSQTPRNADHTDASATSAPSVTSTMSAISATSATSATGTIGTSTSGTEYPAYGDVPDEPFDRHIKISLHTKGFEYHKTYNFGHSRKNSGKEEDDEDDEDDEEDEIEIKRNLSFFPPFGSPLRNVMKMGLMLDRPEPFMNGYRKSEEDKKT